MDSDLVVRFSRACKEIEALSAKVARLEAENAALKIESDAFDRDNNKLRHRLVEYQEARIRDLDAHERENATLKEKLKKRRDPTHGPCCTCQRCGLDHDSCRCDLDEVCDKLSRLQALGDEMAAAIDSAQPSARLRTRVYPLIDAWRKERESE